MARSLSLPDSLAWGVRNYSQGTFYFALIFVYLKRVLANIRPVNKTQLGCDTHEISSAIFVQGWNRKNLQKVLNIPYSNYIKMSSAPLRWLKLLRILSR